MYSKQHLPATINRVISSHDTQKALLFATRNQDKLKEFRRILKIPVEGRDLKVAEIQHNDPVKVLEQKAKDAWAANGGIPIMVEDSALTCIALDDFPGPFADAVTNTRSKRQALCNMLVGLDRS